MRIILLVFVTAAASPPDYVSFWGYKVFQVVATNEEQKVILLNLKSNVHYDFFSEILILDHSVHIMVSPGAQAEFINTLENNGIKYVITDADVESEIERERERLLNTPKLKVGEINFTEFHRLNIIQDYIKQLAINYCNFVSVENFGESFEGRPLMLVKIGSGSDDNPTILIDSTIHAREWIAPAVTTYIIHQLVENPNHRYWVENINWVIIPVLNPDGYEYAFSTNRLWRKTRKPGLICHGVDANRNFAFHWGGNGSDADECSDNFMGSYPFSEPEVVSFVQLAAKINNLVLYLAMHSYGRLLLYPWGWTSESVSNEDEHQELGDAVAEAISAVDGSRYIVGASSKVLYYASGNSVDWMTLVGAPLSYTVELPAGPDELLNGFMLPPERILPSCEEFWPGLVTYANYTINRWRAQTLV